MKIRTAKYIIKEGILNSYRNKLMSLASISIVTASLVIFGIFLIITVNMNYMIDKLKEQPELEIFCNPALDDKQVAAIEASIKGNIKVKEYRMVTKKEAFEKAKELLGDNKKVLEGEDESFMPVSFVVKLKNIEDSREIVVQYKGMAGVENVTYSQEEIDFIGKISHWIKIITSFLLTVLLAISVFIISNTIKLTVFARRKEINIMKYIGATDWFIRWPFIIEGILIGLIGAGVALILLSYGYNTVQARINTEFFSLGGIISLVDIGQFGLTATLMYAVAGIFIGAVGSFISIRKYLHV